MPPMISDDESMSDGVDVPESVPAKATKAVQAKGKGKGKPPAKPESEDEQEDGSDEEEEDEYSVDKILDHRFERGGVVKYKVKWLGYEDEADMTWEPAGNLETAPDKLKEYHSEIGGTPQPVSKKAKKGAAKRTASEALDSPVPSASKKRGGRKSQTNGTEDSGESSFTLPKGSWEAEVSHVMSIVEEDEPDAKPGKDNKCLMGFLQWNDERKSKHPMKTLRTKCPQALLTYYENHLVFAKTEDVPAHLKTEEGN